ncbi:MAG: hypothetical protein UW76_C0037G0002 [Parcubacteria group bacterium GW2011_GWF2_44_8b]|nr:MAG: hypothetical protein UV94_C0006G0045 [Parcubacteria group bacterium GW2011_GWC1_43_30]KKT79099.1 MAG: hypothetical protein UW76_C0037G0002 [Parcubacteria group bacterium GW2011_GWF2_44_8b]KKT84496.1 MAG: hypothetical protein UW83_C0045G0002 [Parcubacteria group bacterium GW2011_GWD1_44_9]
MEQPPQIKTISAIIIILLVLGAGFLLFLKYRTSSLNQENSPTSGGTNGEPATVVVKNTPMVNGIISVPVGFPQGIPLESGSLIESATTQYPGENVQQLSISYRSSKTIAQKYTEYKDYMNQAGYSLTEGNKSAPVRAIFGTKENTNLSVAISSSEGKTLVQLSYLLK